MEFKAINRRYRHLLSYKTYFLLDANMVYPHRLVHKAQTMNKSLHGAFQYHARFICEDPLSIFAFSFTFKIGCDAFRGSHGQALAQLGFRLAGAAKKCFSLAVAVEGSSSPHATLTYDSAVNWLLQKYSIPQKDQRGVL